MKPEYVDEITLDEPTSIKHKAGCIWKLLGSRYTSDQLTRYCNLYGLSTTDALKWQSYWHSMYSHNLVVTTFQKNHKKLTSFLHNSKKSIIFAPGIEGEH